MKLPKVNPSLSRATLFFSGPMRKSLPSASLFLPKKTDFRFYHRQQRENNHSVMLYMVNPTGALEVFSRPLSCYKIFSLRFRMEIGLPAFLGPLTTSVGLMRWDPSVCPYVCLSICPSVRPSVCMIAFAGSKLAGYKCAGRYPGPMARIR